MWPCTDIIAKFLRRSISMLLRSKFSICHIQEKYLSATVLPTGMTYTIWRFRLIEQNIATVFHFVVERKVIFIWSIYHESMLVVAWQDLIFLPDIGWARLFYFDHARERNRIVHNVPSFLNWLRFCFSKCNIKER